MRMAKPTLQCSMNEVNIFKPNGNFTGAGTKQKANINSLIIVAIRKISFFFYSIESKVMFGLVLFKKKFYGHCHRICDLLILFFSSSVKLSRIKWRANFFLIIKVTGWVWVLWRHALALLCRVIHLKIYLQFLHTVSHRKDLMIATVIVIVLLTLIIIMALSCSIFPFQIIGQTRRDKEKLTHFFLHFRTNYYQLIVMFDALTWTELNFAILCWNALQLKFAVKW